MLRREWLYLIVALALLPFMITGDSLWMDEGDTWQFAMQRNFNDWLLLLHHDGGADCQMPLGMFVAWMGGKTLGLSEWQLRAVNLFWGALTLIVMARIGRRLQVPWLPLFFALQPFFWFYTNEARPYAQQITFGAIILLSLVQFIQNRGQGLLWAVTFTIGSVLLCCASMIAPALIAATATVGGIIAYRNGWKIERRCLQVILLGAVSLLPVGYYYIETLIRGAKGVTFWGIDFRYLVYIAYEVSGALGLGPSVVHLRELALRPGGPSPGEIIVQCGLAFFLLAIIALIFFIAIRDRRRNDNPYLLPLLFIFLIEVAVLFTAGLAIHKAFWPRHYSPAFPFYVTALALALGSLVASQRRLNQILPLLMLGLLIAAMIEIRFGPEHQKEDYRWASGQALRFVQQGKDVWWCGAGAASNYYGITFNTRQPGQGEIYLVAQHNWDGKFPFKFSNVESLAPDEVFITRADIHDRNGAVRKFIHDAGYRLEVSRGSFEIWSR